jgi:hypothetical protein
MKNRKIFMPRVFLLALVIFASSALAQAPSARFAYLLSDIFDEKRCNQSVESTDTGVTIQITDISGLSEIGEFTAQVRYNDAEVATSLNIQNGTFCAKIRIDNGGTSLVIEYEHTDKQDQKANSYFYEASKGTYTSSILRSVDFEKTEIKFAREAKALTIKLPYKEILQKTISVTVQ